MIILTFFLIVAASYIGGLLALLTNVFIDNDVPVKNYIGDQKLYNLTFIHISAKQYERDGIHGDELINKLQNTKYGFIINRERRLNEPSRRLSKRKKRAIEYSEQAYIFAMKVLYDKDLLVKYIIPDGFDENVCQELCEEMQFSEEQKAANSVIQKILVNKSRKNIEKMIPLLALWNTRPFIIDSKNSVQTTAGLYQLLLYECLASKELNVIDCTRGEYITAMKILKAVYPQMEDMRGESTLSNYSDIYKEGGPDVTYIKEVISRYL